MGDKGWISVVDDGYPSTFEGPLSFGYGRSRKVRNADRVRARDLDKMESVCRSVLVMLRAMRDAGIDVGQSVKEIEDAIGIG